MSFDTVQCVGCPGEVNRPPQVACNYCWSPNCPMCSTCCSDRMMVQKDEELEKYTETSQGFLSSRNQRRLRHKREHKRRLSRRPKKPD